MKLELGLLCAGLQDMKKGRLPVGGKTTRGLGHCVLEELRVEEADLSTVEGVQKYLQEEAAEVSR